MLVTLLVYSFWHEFLNGYSIKHLTMPFNLLKTLQENLHYPEIRKVDPNIQEVVWDVNASDLDKFAQAAMPAVLTGLYKYAETDKGIKALTTTYNSDNWFEEIFDYKAQVVIQRIANYSGLAPDTVKTKVHEISNEAVKEVKQKINASGNVLSLRDFMNAQRANFLPYLPAALQMSKLLNDSILDDRTNKMKGPVSNFMHGIESIFSGADNADNKEKF